MANFRRQRDFTQAMLGGVLAPQQNQTALTGLARILSAGLLNKRLKDIDTRESSARKADLANVMQFAGGPPVDVQGNEMAGPPRQFDREGLARAMLGSSDPRFQEIGLRNLFPKEQGGGIGTYNPRDYTTKSWALFTRTRNPSVLERYAPKRTTNIGGVEHGFDPVTMQWHPARVRGEEVTPETVGESEGIIEGLKTQAKIEGKAAGEKAAGQGAAASKVRSMGQKFDRLNTAIDTAKDQSGFWTTGFIGSQAAKLPGTGAFDLTKTVQTIQANIGFEELQRMRDESPTGGALGQVSERELGFLQSVIANLENSQSQEQFESNLEVVRDSARQSWQRVAEAYKQDYGQYPEGFQQEQDNDPLGIL